MKSRFRVGMLVATAHILAHNAEQHLRTVLIVPGSVWLALWTLLGGAAVYLLASGWRSRAQLPGFSRIESIIGGVLLVISSLMLILDPVLTFYFRHRMAEIVHLLG